LTPCGAFRWRIRSELISEIDLATQKAPSIQIFNVFCTFDDEVVTREVLTPVVVIGEGLGQN